MIMDDAKRELKDGKLIVFIELLTYQFNKSFSHETCEEKKMKI